MHAIITSHNVRRYARQSVYGCTAPTRLTLILLGLSVVLALTGCAATLTGVSGPVDWQVTDLRVVERSVDGMARDLYAFTLVLNETQGRALTLTQLEQTVSQPGVNPAGSSQQVSIHWKLRPHGELRQPRAIYYYCAESQCRPSDSIAPWYNIVLTGTNDRGQPVRVAMDFRLPSNPPKPKLEVSTGTPVASPGPAASPGNDSGPVPFQTVGSHILVPALLDHKEYVTLLLDTGATHTLLTPATAKRVGLRPTADTPKRTLTVLGGRQVEAPLMQLAALTVGKATQEYLPVGVLESFPEAPLVDGILGGNFLHPFTMTLDYATSRLQLRVPEAPRPSPAPSTAGRAVVHSAVPVQIVGNQILVQAVLNHRDAVTLLLDTGATHTILTPQTARRLGISPAANALRRTVQGADGHRHEVPFVQLASLAVGAAVMEHFSVGVVEVFPQAATIDGLLGVDFLEQFALRLDRTAQRLELEAR
jgi:clan AA aspartic protease (TIGR02281 family)